MKPASQSRLALALLFCVALEAPAVAADPQAGQRLTQQWCTSCHVIGEGNRGTDSAPSLPVIARVKGNDREWLRAWLTAPHAPMPNLSLTRQEIDDIVAYLNSLPQR
jgi:mono/diheme cytochrome c family protein